MEFDMNKDRYEKLKKTIKNVFEGTTEELNALIESYDTTLVEKNFEIAEVSINIMCDNIFVITYCDLLFTE